MVDKTLAKVAANRPQTEESRQAVDEILPKLRAEAQANMTKSWGILAFLGIDRWLQPIDDALRGPFMPYGLSGIMLGAAIVFFAYIGFDSISTHAEEAKNPARDMPIAILASLAVCTVLYVAVTAVITGMVPYPNIDIHAPIAAAFADKAAEEKSTLLKIATSLIAAGGLAGMTSVLLVMLQSQARIFMAMSRDGLLPKVFSVVHPRFRTPHLSTLITGTGICLVAAFTPIQKLEEMVNIGTLMAFAIVCAAVLLLRFQRPDAKRPFRCPAILVVAPLGVVVNFAMMLFLPGDTWAAVGDLARDRADDLLPLQPPAQPPDQEPAARDSDARRRGSGLCRNREVTRRGTVPIFVSAKMGLSPLTPRSIGRRWSAKMGLSPSTPRQPHWQLQPLRREFRVIARRDDFRQSKAELEEAAADRVEVLPLGSNEGHVALQPKAEDDLVQPARMIQHHGHPRAGELLGHGRKGLANRGPVALQRNNPHDHHQVDAAIGAGPVHERFQVGAVVVDQFENEALDSSLFVFAKQRHSSGSRGANRCGSGGPEEAGINPLILVIPAVKGDSPIFADTKIGTVPLLQYSLPIGG